MRRYVLLGVDVALILFATFLAFALRENLEFVQARYEAFAPYLVVTAFISALFFAAAGLNRSIWRFSGMHDYVRIAAVVTMVCVGSVALSFAYNRLEGVPRSLPFLQGIVGVMVLVSARVLHRMRHSSRRKKAAAFEVSAKNCEINVLVVGLTRLTEAYLQTLSDFGSGRINVAGIVARADRHVGRLVGSYPILGVPEDIESVLDALETHGVAVDRIVVAAPFADLTEEAREALLRIERSRGVALQFLTEILALDASGARGDAAHEEKSRSTLSPEQSVTPPASWVDVFARRPFWKVKRCIDIVGALAIVLAAAPVFLIVACVVATSVGFPVIFWQRRPGLKGRSFHLYKFRTMGAAHAPDGRHLSDAERVSRAGNFLRRTRLDELPQLINILRGDMSFVGPRPLLPRDQPKSSAARLLVRPGLTGWAQVVGGRDIPPEDKAALDVWYVRNASLLLDLEVLARTIPMVLFGERVSEPLIERARRETSEPGIIQGKLVYGIENRLHAAPRNI
jgi:lipopolysaccharide/colanic/teichoic acid biosynthesis glycosyltransferase